MSFANKNDTTSFGVPEGGQEFEKPPVGPTGGVVSGVFFVGTHQIDYKAKCGVKNKARLAIEITLNTKDKEGEHFVMLETFNASCFGQSGLKAFLAGLSGESIGDDFKDFHYALWTPGLFNLSASDDGKYVNVASAMPLPEGMGLAFDVDTMKADTAATRLFSMMTFDAIIFAGLSRRVQKSCMKSFEWKEGNLIESLREVNPQLADDLSGSGQQSAAPAAQGNNEAQNQAAGGFFTGENPNG